MDYTSLLRTANSIKVTHEFGSYIGKYGQTMKDTAKGASTVKQHAAKKLFTNASLDYSVKAAVDTIVTEVEGLMARQLTFATKLIEMSVAIELKTRDQEVARKKVVDNAHRAEREYHLQLDTLKKAKEKYVKLGQDYDTISNQVTKAKAANDKKAGQLAAKQAKALEAFKAAETEYKDTLDETNKKQEQYFNEEMPSILKEFNNFETERINYLKEKIIEFSQEINEFPATFEKAGTQITTTGNAIDAANDITQYVTDNPTKFTIPSAIQFEPYVTVDGVETNSTGSTSATTSSAPKKEQEHKPVQTTPPQQNQTKQQTLPPPRPSTHPQTQAQQASSTPQQPQQKQQLPPPNESSSQKTEVVNEEQSPENVSELKMVCKCRCLYNYTASCNNELSFAKDDIAEIFEQDSSGWWFAQVNGKRGYVPKNYLAQM